MAVAVVLLTTFLWASAFVGIRAGLDGYGPFELAFLRFLVASLILAGVALWKPVRMPQRGDWLRITAGAVTGFTIYNFALNVGEMTITAGEASFIVNTVPIWTSLLAVAFLGERLTLLFAIGTVVSFIGVTIIALQNDGSFSIKPGSLLVISAALSQAIFFTFQKPLLARYSARELTSFMIWIGTILMVPWGWTAVRTITTADVEPTASVIYLGVLPTALGFSTWAFALSRMPASRATAFLFIVPVFAIALEAVWLGVVPTAAALVGGALALAGVAVANGRLRLLRHARSRT